MKFAVAGLVVASSALLAGCAVYPDGTPAYGGGYPAAGYDPGYDPYGYGGPVVQSGVYVGGGSYYGPSYYGGPPPRRYWDDGPGYRHPSQGGWQGQGRPPGDNGHGGNHGGPPPGQQAGGGNHGGPPPGQQAGGGGGNMVGKAGCRRVADGRRRLRSAGRRRAVRRCWRLPIRVAVATGRNAGRAVSPPAVERILLGAGRLFRAGAVQ